MVRGMILSIALFLLLPVDAFTQDAPLESFVNQDFEVREVNMGRVSEGVNQFSAVLLNKSGQIRFPVIDIRTVGNGLGLSSWQKQFHFQLDPGERREVVLEYQIFTPRLDYVRFSFGETDRAFDRDAWLSLSAEARAENPPPQSVFHHRAFLPDSLILRDSSGGVESAYDGEAFLTPLRPERLSEIKALLPLLREAEREGGDPLRDRLTSLFLSGRRVAPAFDPQPLEWKERSRAAENLERNGITAEVFSIRGDEDNRIAAFFATRQEDPTQEKPLILLLGGNPGGTKERLVGRAIYLAQIGYHVVGMERRESARLLDSKEKFLPNFTDPVFDALRLLEYLRTESEYSISKIGILGTSAGAMEGKFVAALDGGIDAAALAYGTSSFEDLFRERAWIPTFSGMIIYPELGLGTPAIGQMSSEEFWAQFEKVEAEHDARAREIFEEIFPFFNDLDPEVVVPLMAPVPVLIVSGAQDDQFRPEGATAVDRATLEAYRGLGVAEASEHHIQPRIGHALDARGAAVITAFFERWLR